MTTEKPELTGDLNEKLADLSPEQARMFVEALELAIRKRRILLIGYLVAITVVLVGLLVSLLIFGAAPKGTFVGWVFLVPGVGAAITLIAFGKIAKRIGRK